jgi:two-component system cell cycle sensor histidine kinase/response regulator CckA
MENVREVEMNPRTESKCSHAINASRLHLMQFAMTHSLDELLEETLNEAEKLTGSVIGFYHFVDDDQKTLTLQNWSTRTIAEFSKAEGKSLHCAIAETGVLVDCVYQRKAVVHNNYTSLPHVKGMPEGHAVVIRELVVPVIRGDKIKAILGVGNKPSDYNEKDVETISLLADIAGEIAECKRADEALRRLNRKLLAISSCNQVLMRSVDEQALLNDICRIICDETGYRMAWVGYAENDDAKNVRPVAWAGVEDGYLATADITWADTEQGRGPTGTAIRSGESAYIKDFTTDPKSAPWRDGGLQRGYRSSIALPLKDENGNTFGALNIYSTEPDAFTTRDEVRLLEELTGDLAFGINVLRARNARKEAERNIALLSFALNNVSEATFLIDDSANFCYVNEESCRVLGYTRDELLGLGVTDVDPDFPMERWLGHWDELKTRGSMTFEGRHKAKDGSIFPVEINANYFEYDGEEYNLALVRDITDRKRIENVLRESEERFRTLTEKSLVGVYIIQDGLFRYVNPAFAEKSGYAPEEIIDRLGPVDFLTPEDRDRVLDSIRCRTLGEIEFSHHEFHTRCKDGSNRVVEAFGSRALHHGRPAVLGTIIDITERRRSEEKLFQATERWKRTFDAVPDLIAIVDTDFRIVQVNKAMADRLGSTPAECAGHVCYEVIHKTEAPPSFCPHTLTLRDCREHMAEVSEEGLGGDFIVSTSPIYDSAEQLIGSVHVARDITERKHAETMLNEQLHFLQQLLDSIPIPVYYKDTDGLYLGCNAAFETFISVPRRDIVGKTVYDVAPKERADKHHEADSALLCHPGVQIYEVSGMYKDGEYHDVLFNKATFFDANDCVTGIVGAMMDITSLRKAEEARKTLEAQLHQAQKMEAIGQLAGGIAHDFNNILTAIIGYAEIILLRMEKESPLRHFVEQVLASADRAAELTNGLLAFSRKQVLHRKPIDLCSVVRGLKKMLRRLLPEDIDFRTTVAKVNLIIMADKGQIEQVLMNLVTNAKDAMQKGGTLTIEISPVVMAERFVHAHGFGEPGNYACVSVTDTGHGMDEETTKRIFEPFFTTKEVGKGTGLGMAIIYGIIQQHNGCITVCSETGKGTTFRIYLPLIVEEIKEVHGTRKAEALPRGTETVLLVEDEVTVRELHKMILEGAGYRIVEAVDGQDALDKFMEQMSEVDIVVTDVIMPKIDGKKLYEEIRGICPDMKVLFMSGYTKDVIVERGVLEDEFSFINKPAKSFELLKKVRDVLDRDRC